MNIKTRNNLTDLVGQLPVEDNPSVAPFSSGNDEPISSVPDLNDNQAVDEHGEVVDLGYSDEDPNRMNSDKSSKDKNGDGDGGFDYFFS